MRYEVLLTRDAERDIEGIHDYIARHDSPAKATQILDRFEAAIETLATFPERGSHPRELQDLGIREYRQTFFKPYRLIYRVIEQRVYVYLIADGRRDMQTLLTQRLVSG